MMVEELKQKYDINIKILVETKPHRKYYYLYLPRVECHKLKDVFVLVTKLNPNKFYHGKI
jgi:hypothetical protein